VDYSDRWRKFARETPAFFSLLVQYDQTHKTAFTKETIEALNQIVHTVSLLDGEASSEEVNIADAYLARLSQLFRKTLWTVKWDEGSRQTFPIGTTLTSEDLKKAYSSRKDWTAQFPHKSETW
jgi:hypothetical protein